MYPNLYFAFKDLFGVEWSILQYVQSFGFFVAASFLAASYYFTLELKRKEKEGLVKPLPPLTDGGAIIHPFEHVGNMTIVAAITGFLGARIFHIFENLGQFMNDPSAMIFTRSGFTMYGGLILAAFCVTYYAYRKGIKPLPLIDACAPGLMLAYGIGRMGCHISGDGDWGINNSSQKPSWFVFPDWAWKYNYPNNVNEECGTPDCIWEQTPYLVNSVFPTPLYECIACILLFGVLWMMRKKIASPGMLFSIYIILNGCERFMIEKIRVNNKFDVLGMRLTQAEIIAMIFILIGSAGAYLAWLNHKRKMTAS